MDVKRDQNRPDAFGVPGLSCRKLVRYGHVTFTWLIDWIWSCYWTRFSKINTGFCTYWVSRKNYKKNIRFVTRDLRLYESVRWYNVFPTLLSPKMTYGTTQVDCETVNMFEVIVFYTKSLAWPCIGYWKKPRPKSCPWNRL